MPVGCSASSQNNFQFTAGKVLIKAFMVIQACEPSRDLIVVSPACPSNPRCLPFDRAGSQGRQHPMTHSHSFSHALWWGCKQRLLCKPTNQSSMGQMWQASLVPRSQPNVHTQRDCICINRVHYNYVQPERRFLLTCWRKRGCVVVLYSLSNMNLRTMHLKRFTRDH
jgi:hypothetical protein